MANPNIVSVSSIKGESVGYALSNTVTTTLMTVSSDKIVKINRITVANVDGTNAADVTLSATGSSDSNVNINFAPKGTGEIVIGTGSANATLTTNGAHDLILDTNSGINSGVITIVDGANGNITITPNGSGNVVLDGLTFPNADGSANQALITDGSGTISFGTAGITTGKAIAMAIVFG